MITNSFRSNYMNSSQEVASATNHSESPEKHKKTRGDNDEESKKTLLPSLNQQAIPTQKSDDSLSRQKFERMLSRNSSPHTMEFFSAPRCDENFNNKHKVIKQSFFSKVILSDPVTFGKEASELTKKMSSLLKDNVNDAFLMQTVSSDVSKEGQFGRLPNNMNEILEILDTDASDPINLAQKMSAIKSFGDYLTKCITTHDNESTFLSDDDKKQLKLLLKKYRPDELFSERGRTGVISKAHREDIGILDKKTFDSLQNKSAFLIDGLSKERPLFRTSSSISPYVDKNVKEDNPLVGSASGSAACIFLAADFLGNNLNTKGLLLTTAAFLVGGGYHSEVEAMDVVMPGYTMQNGVQENYDKEKYDNTLHELNEVLDTLKVKPE